MSDPSQSADVRLARAGQLIEELVETTPEGAASAIDALVAAHADLAAELRELWTEFAAVERGFEAEAERVAQDRKRVEAAVKGLGTFDSFHDRYRIVGQIGAGGMGVVYRVVDQKLHRELAMKVVLGQAQPTATGKTPPLDSRKLARFLNEAELTAQLDHPGIVPVHELGADEDGRVFFTMKLVKGQTLKDLFAARARNDPKWTMPAILGVLERVCLTMAFAHERGVIHRDLKPANIMVGDFGEVYVMDWGLARRVDGRPDPSAPSDSTEQPSPASIVDEQLAENLTLTRDGHVVGTPAYMPPEQALGKLDEVGKHSDVYSLGAILHELLAGYPPYCEPGKDPSGSAVLRRIVTGEPSTLVLPKVAPELVAICEKAMTYEVRGRYSSVRELAEDIQAFVAFRAVKAFRTGAWADAKKWVQRNAPLAVSLVAATILAIGGSIAYYLQLRSALEHERKADSILHMYLEDRIHEQNTLRSIFELRDLQNEASHLWPAVPEKLALIDRWIARATTVIDGIPDNGERPPYPRPGLSSFERELVDLRRRSGKSDDSETDNHMRRLTEIVEGLHALSDPTSGLFSEGVSNDHGWGMRRRRSFAATIGERTIDGPQARQLWNEAISAISSSERYAGSRWPSGQVPSPQAGLIPIGEDPRSHLWEFAHLLSGEAPERDPDGRVRRDVYGQLVLKPESCIVLVLLPGGSFKMGAQSANPVQPNYDPLAEQDEGPPKEITISPFFISKYEMTQAQWQFIATYNPSYYDADHYTESSNEAGSAHSFLLPVEQVSWYDCRTMLARLGLSLPSEAQWEYAARAGTAAPWWTGPEPEGIEGAANIADAFAKSRSGAWVCEEWNDGFLASAPVGSFRPNAFGLHDVIGNVSEWCLDIYTPSLPGAVAATDGGEKWGRPVPRSIRGGAFSQDAVGQRLSYRNNNTPGAVDSGTGVRPVLELATAAANTADTTNTPARREK